MPDLAFGWVVYALKHVEDIVGASKFIKAETFPRLIKWFENFSEVLAIKNNLSDPDKVTEFLKKRRKEIVSMK